MTPPTHFKCNCQHCEGPLECPVEAAGQMLACPHCGQPTLLAPADTAPKSKAKLFVIPGVLIAIVGLAMVLFRLRSTPAPVTEPPAPVANPTEIPADNPFASSGWQVSDPRLEQTPGSSIVHATGKLLNQTDRRRFGVKVRLDLMDAAGQPVGSASDYQGLIEAHAEWTFRALVVGTRAVAAKVAAIEETP